MEHPLSDSAQSLYKHRTQRMCACSDGILGGPGGSNGSDGFGGARAIRWVPEGQEGLVHLKCVDWFPRLLLLQQQHHRACTSPHRTCCRWRLPPACQRQPAGTHQLADPVLASRSAALLDEDLPGGISWQHQRQCGFQPAGPRCEPVDRQPRHRTTSPYCGAESETTV